MLGVLRELEHARRGRGCGRCGRDVVDHDRHRARGGDRLEVRDDAGLRRAHVVRHDDRARPRAPACRASASTAAIVLAVLLVPGADDQLRAALGARRGARVDRPRAARRRRAPATRRWCRARRCPRARRRGTRAHSALDRVERDGSVGRERRDERDVDALEQPVGWHRRARVPRSASSPGPEKDGVDHRLGELAGERVLLTRVVAAEHDGRRPSAPRRPWPNCGRGIGQRRAATRRAPAPTASYANPPSTTTTRDAVEQRRARGRGTAGSGRAPRASACCRAARTAPRPRRTRRAARARRRRRPTSAGWRSRCGASTPKSQSPERSPVKTRPVRFPPCAAGARPATSTARLRIAEAGHRPAPVLSSRNAARFSRGDLLAPLDEPGARPALDDLGGERASAERRSVPASYGPRRGCASRVGFAAVRVLLIVNPIASSVTPRAIAAVVDARSRPRHDLDVVETDGARPRDRRSRARRRTTGVDVVVVLAGDGTLNEAAQRAGRDIRPRSAPLPGGSTNVFARALGIAYDADRRRPRSSSRSLDARHAAHGSAWVPRRTAAPIASLPVPPRARLRRRRRPARWRTRSYLKRYLAHPAFAVATVDTWLRHYDRDTRISVEVPRRDGRAPDRASGPYAVVSNSDPYTYVGRRPVTISPDASLDRALAVTSSLRPAHRRSLVRAAASGLRHARVPRHATRPSCSSPTSTS